MTPAARLQGAIDILEALAKTDQPLDRLLRDWFRTRRYAGSKDRAAITQRVFTIQRHRASLAWRMQAETPRALAIASLLQSGEEPESLFTGGGYGPAELTDAERVAIAQPLRGDAPVHVRCEFPAFLEPELTRAFGSNLLDEMVALQSRAPVDLRVNTLKRERGEVLDALRAREFPAEPTPFAPHGIRIASGEGSAELGRSVMFETGAFEFQDEAAQIASLLCQARPGERILDLAAGAGGKSLALAATMQNKGEIVACDIRQPALQQLAARATRAGATIIRTHLTEKEPPDGPFDAVLVDAPCTGTGTWRRQPELRWRLSPELLKARMALQDKLLNQAAARVKKGGRLIYATCSILPCENEDRVNAFLARHPDFAVRPCAQVWRESDEAPPGLDAFFKASPRATGTDGFFTAVFRKRE
ncbi:MAG: RsmB/NOP family class I SAM-dependent RNA methyltransferase [Rhizomicrobium sp.]